jgi:hypothetical protein
MQELLGVYSLGALPVERIAALEAHLLLCSPCLMECAELTRTVIHLQRLSDVDLAVRASLRGWSGHVDRPSRSRPGPDDHRDDPGPSTGDETVQAGHTGGVWIGEERDQQGRRIPVTDHLVRRGDDAAGYPRDPGYVADGDR